MTCKNNVHNWGEWEDIEKVNGSHFKFRKCKDCGIKQKSRVWYE